MAPSAVNNAGRADEGIIARYYFDNDTSVTATLSGSVIQFTANRASLTLTGTTSNYFANLVMGFTMGDNPITGPASININSIGPISLRDNNGASLSSSFILSGQRCVVIKDGANDYFRLVYPDASILSAINTASVTDQAAAGVTGESKALVITNNGSNPTFQVDIDADEIVLKTADGGVAKIVSSVNLTADLTASGADGLDTSTEANSTHYYVWVIYDSTNDTTASLLSTSATAPTMPGTYDYKALVGAVYNNSSGNLLVFEQHGKIIWTKDIITSWQALNAGAATAVTSVDLSAFVPAIVNDVQLWVETSRNTATAGSLIAAIYGDAAGSHKLSDTIGFYDGTNSLIGASRQWHPLLTAQTTYYNNGKAGISTSIWVAGFRMP